MTEIEKLEAGLEYCYDDSEVEARKENAIIQCKEYNAIDDTSVVVGDEPVTAGFFASNEEKCGNPQKK